MIPIHPDETHDYLMSESDDIFIYLRERYPALDAAIGKGNFSEIREGSNRNSYSVVLLLPTLAQCVVVRKYTNLIIEAHKTIPSSALESFQIIYSMPNSEEQGYTEETFFTYTF